MNDHDRTEDDGLAPDEGTNWERQESGEEASIQVYLDDGWYWDSRKLTHPMDKGVEHKDRSAYARLVPHDPARQGDRRSGQAGRAGR